MKIRANTLWRIPVFCAISSAISFLLTVYLGGFFFTVKTIGINGIAELSIHPLRSAIFNGSLFVAVLLLGGLWVCRSMTRSEIVASAGIISAIYLAVTIAQLYLPHFPLSFSMTLAYFQNWTGILSSFLIKLTGNLHLSVLLSAFAPFLFVPFGK